MLLVGEKVRQGIIFLCGGIKGIEDFGLRIKGQSPAFAGTGNHFMRKLLSRGSDEVVGLQIQFGHQFANRLRPEVPFYFFVHIFLIKYWAI